MTLFPCNECCKAIIRAGIKTVIYDCDKYAGHPVRDRIETDDEGVRSHFSEIPPHRAGNYHVPVVEKDNRRSAPERTESSDALRLYTRKDKKREGTMESNFEWITANRGYRHPLFHSIDGGPRHVPMGFTSGLILWMMISITANRSCTTTSAIFPIYCSGCKTHRLEQIRSKPGCNGRSQSRRKLRCDPAEPHKKRIPAASCVSTDISCVSIFRQSTPARL